MNQRPPEPPHPEGRKEMASLSEVQTLPRGFLPRLGPRPHLRRGMNPSNWGRGRLRSPSPTATGQRREELRPGLRLQPEKPGPGCGTYLRRERRPLPFCSDGSLTCTFLFRSLRSRVANRAGAANSVCQKRKLRQGGRGVGSLGVASRAGRGLSSGSVTLSKRLDAELWLILL